MSRSSELECVFEWRIRNLSYCWFKTGEALESPNFFADASTTQWSIVVYPRGDVDDDRVGVRLRRKAFLGPFLENHVEASSKFALLDKNDSLLFEGTVTKQDVAIPSVSDITKFVRHDKLFGTEGENFIPDGILKVQCTLWIKNQMSSVKKLYLCAETIFEINRRDFFWKIKGFSNSNPQSNHFRVMNGDENIMTFSICLKANGEIYLKRQSWNKIIKSMSFDISLIDSEKRRVTFGSHKILTANDCDEHILLLSREQPINPKQPTNQPTSREQLMENKSRYLPNDVLSLVCEFTYSSGIILDIIPSKNFRPIYPDDSKKAIENLETLLVPSRNEPQQTEKLAADLKSMDEDPVPCDTKLRTSTKSFPAHKSILSARSSVFSKMFSSDMRETNSGHVDITDLEDDTVHRMLLYIYTDFFGDLQFESASKLYSAADKYKIFSLKEKCASFLSVNVSPATACGLLILADRHQDDDLKSAVQDYILDHGREIFRSQEWKDFMVTNVQLAADIMYRKVV